MPIRWQIMLVFLIIIGVSFAFAATRLTNYVSEYLYQQRIRQDSISVERLATTVAPLFQSAQSDALSETLKSSSNELGGRLLVLDNDAKIQFDSFSALMGTRLQLPETLAILSGQPQAYGLHALQEGNALTGNYVACCASSIIGTKGNLGILVFIADVDEMMASLSLVRRELLIVFGLVAAAALLAAGFFSHLLTRPVLALTRTIQNMARGDLSVRAPVTGSGEIRNLAENYNAMAEQLESLDRSRNQFVSNASHELKTPMTSMKLLLENVIYQPDMPSELRSEFLQDINHEIDRLTHIVTDLLELTRMDNHQMKLDLSEVSLSGIIMESIRMLAPAAEQRSQQILSDIAPNVTILGDHDKLKQIATNLMDNALKYSQENQSISVSLSVKGKKAYFAVTDHGVGISADDQKHIFERFYRVDKARSRETGGTGLGLSIVRQLVNLHHGEITVDSMPGQGSTFTVTLPLNGKDGDAR